MGVRASIPLDAFVSVLKPKLSSLGRGRKFTRRPESPFGPGRTVGIYSSENKPGIRDLSNYFALLKGDSDVEPM